MKLSHASKKPLRVPKIRGGRLGIGFIAGSFGSHAVTEQFSGALLELDSSRFSTRCYALNPDDDSRERRELRTSRKLCEKWHDLSKHVWNTQSRARMVAAHQNQILMNLDCAHGGKMGNKLLALEVMAVPAAPVQTCHIGFQGTTGANFVHYRHSDSIGSPPSLAVFSEKVVLHPNSNLICNQRRTHPECLEIGCGEQPPEPERVLWGAFSSLYKMDPLTWNVATNALRRTPAAAVWVLEWPKQATQALVREAKSAGLSTQAQVLVTGIFSSDQHVMVKSQSDLLLDTAVYGWHTTLADMLWAGVPAVTQALDHMATRIGAGLIQDLQLFAGHVETRKGFEDLLHALSSSEHRSVL